MANDLSSEKTITKALSDGDVRKIKELTGSCYQLSGIVVHGDHLGRTIGFPTANLQLLPENRLLPLYGVYAVHAEYDGTFQPAVANIGTRPTVSGRVERVEVHLLGFSGDLYGLVLTIHFYDRIREERKFGSLDELSKQIRADCKSALSILKG